MNEVLRSWSIDAHDKSVPYNSQGNTSCERMNRGVRRHLDSLALVNKNRLWSALEI